MTITSDTCLPSCVKRYAWIRQDESEAQAQADSTTADDFIRRRSVVVSGRKALRFGPGGVENAHAHAHAHAPASCKRGNRSASEYGGCRCGKGRC